MSKRALLVLLLFALNITAQNPENECAGTTYDMSVCLNAIYKQVDTELNATYQQALKTTAQFYTEKDVQKLKDAQRKWIAYRDAECDATRGLWGFGTGAPNAFTMCLVTLSRARTELLKADYGRH